jgi:uncharacterized repeat protein (TIGR01451 family)
MVYVLCLLMLVQSMTPAVARVPDGAVMIKTRAEVRYFDTSTGENGLMRSAPVRMQVTPVLGGTLTGPAHWKVAAGTPLAVPFTVLNTGNISADYQVSLEGAGAAWQSPGTARVVLDENGNGIAEATEPVLYTQAAGSIPLKKIARDTQRQLLVVADVIDTATGIQSLELKVTALARLGAPEFPMRAPLEVEFVQEDVDLLPYMDARGPITADVPDALVLRVRNNGRQSSAGEITLRHQLSQGTSPDTTFDRDGWHCEIRDSIAQCTTTQSIAPGGFSTPVTLPVLMPEAAMPEGATRTTVTSMLRVAGPESTSEYAASNNELEVSHALHRGAIVTGSVWLDAGHDGRRDGDDMPLEGWRAQWLENRDGAQIVVAEAVTNASGIYTLRALRPGKVNGSLRFLTPQGTHHGVPQDGEQGQARSGARVNTRLGTLEYSDIEPGTQLGEQSLAVSPTGVIYNAHTREPVKDAQVKLVAPEGAKIATDVPMGDDTVKSDAHGYYFLPIAPGAPDGIYQLQVTANGYKAGFSELLPPQMGAYTLQAGEQRVQRVVDSVSIPVGEEPVVYYTSFAHTAGAARPVNNHVALDPADDQAASPLVLAKLADRQTVEPTDFVNYTLTLNHKLNGVLNGFQVTDTLPGGFHYISGTARLGASDAGGSAIEPVQSGNQLRFDAPNFSITPGAQAVITYRVRVDSSVREGTRAINRAQALSGPLRSNVATAVVRVRGGVLSPDAFVAGKVFFDRNGNGGQDPDEPGVPGVRLYTEMGTWVETDEDGKYSLYGLKPTTHVLKIDPTTMPKGAVSQPISNRNSGNGQTVFVDLKNGELGRADFALTGDASMLEIIAQRRAARSNLASEIEAGVKARMDDVGRTTDYLLRDIRTRAASGTIDRQGQTSSEHQGEAPGTATATDGSPSDAPGATPFAVPSPTGAASAVSTTPISPAAPTSGPIKQQDIEALLKSASPELAILDLKDGQVVSARQITVRVKGADDATLQLAVNDAVVAESKIGQRSALANRHVAINEYVAVALKPGRNTLTARAVKAGAVAGEVSLTVIAPGDIARFELTVQGEPVADGQTAVPVTVRAVDAAGVPVPVSLPITLDIPAGKWMVDDLDADKQGVQVMLERGEAHVDLLPPSQPGEVNVRISSGVLSSEHGIAFMPALRPMLAVGVIDGMITLNNGVIRQAGPQDGFEQELTRFARDFNDGRQSVAGRSAFFLKGKVKGEYLLTAAFDSEKDGTTEPLFRDIEPDRYYPVYGDSSVRGFDAQSTSRLYLRVDKGLSYLVYGDFSSAGASDVRQLTQYSRGLTGLKHHFEGKRFSVTTFASYDNLTQKVKEFPADGGSVYLDVIDTDFAANSERVEIITRSVDQTGVVLAIETKSRGADYTIDPVDGALRFHEQISMANREYGNNPQFIRITYETRGEEKFLVYGGEAQVEVIDGVKVGAVGVDDRNPAEPRRLLGATLDAKVGEHAQVIGEVASTRAPEKDNGLGGRIEIRYEDERRKGKVTYLYTNTEYDNLSAAAMAGRSEARAQGEYRVNERTTLKVDALRSNNENVPSSGLVSGGEPAKKLLGAQVSVAYQVTESLTIEGGVRKATGSTPDGQQINLTTMRARATMAVPFLQQARMFAEVEQDVRDAGKRAVAVGADYQLNERSKVYARHEVMSSLGSSYDLETGRHNMRTLAGVETEYLPQAKLFSEYRVGGGFDGRDAQAAIGLRNGWDVADGMRLSTKIERTQALGGVAGRESTVLGAGVEYFKAENWKGSTSLELRHGNQEQGFVHTFGIGLKLNSDWTMLGKSAVYFSQSRGSSTGPTTLRMRQRVGFAYRPVEQNVANVLGYYEHRLEHGRTAVEGVGRRQAHIVSTHANIQPIPHTTVSGRYAARYVHENGRGIGTSAFSQIVSGRIAHDLNKDWDIGLLAAVRLDGNFSRAHSLGVELGYQVQKDLWLSVGGNLVGFSDPDFSESHQTAKGVFMRMRFKFDETSW